VLGVNEEFGLTLTVIAIGEEADEVPHPLEAVTVRLPDIADDENDITTALPLPEIVAPDPE
jgi:hypothetical protein